jgi:cellulose synthase/poly-beta-1,6-N-acetylglucosamine synthase-like glycosyltransferase
LHGADKDVSVPPMIGFRVLQALLALFTLFWASYVLAMPMAACVRRRRRLPELRGHGPSIAVIVPAHDMASEIRACVAAIRAAAIPGAPLAIHVVADHCTDETAARAREAGAQAWARGDGPPGKTYAIAWALERLKESGADPDIYVITDSTARLDVDFFRALIPNWQRGENIIVGHSIVSPENLRWFARCLGLTLVHRNLQNWARDRLGLSSLIEGRAMAFSRSYVRQFGWTLALPTQAYSGQHPTEDWRHGVRVVENGLRVCYEDDARVYTPLRPDLGAATRQGIRWERGRQLNAISHGLRLLRVSLVRRNRLAFFAALDAIQLPVAVLGACCVASAALTWGVAPPAQMRALGYGSMVLMLIYGLFVTFRGRREGISPATIAWAPIYLLWRLAAFVLAWTPAGRGRPPDR